MYKFEKIILSGLLTAGLVSFAGVALAQSSAGDVYITWRAHTYSPAAYAGRSLPTTNSQVTAEVSLVQGGKVADLSGENIAWYANGDLIKSGVGLQEISLNMPEVVGATIDLRAEIGNGDMLKTVTLQAAAPKVTIVPALPANTLSSSQIVFRAVPYFFNDRPDKLSYDWLINNQPPDTSDAPQQLVLTIKSGTPFGFEIDLQATVRNAKHLFESATKSLSLTFGS